MKKLTLSILSLIFLLCAAIGLVGCGKETHKHSFTEQKVEQQYLASEATCTESAKYYYSCSCGEKGTETFASGNALGHSFTNYVSNNNATCTQDGTKTAKCDRCTEKDTIADENSRLPHTFDKQVTTEKYLASPATCTEPAKHYYSCGCGEKGTETFASGNALGHSFTNYVSDNNATCTQDGTKTAKCDRCKVVDTITDEGSKLPHTFDKQVANEKYLVSEATCTEPAKHYYSCGCGEKGTETFTYGNAKNHDYGTPVYVWSSDYSTCTATRVCRNDGNHIETETATATITVTRQKSCVSDELSTFTATFENSAFTIQTQENVKTADKLGHDLTHHAAKAATCTEIGWNAYDTCTRCDYTTYAEISALGHDYATGWTIDIQPTCTEAGEKSRHCTRCNSRSNITEIEKLGHSFTNYVSDNNATCTQDGTKTAICDRNGCNVKSTVTDEGSAKGHTYSEEWTTNETEHWHVATCGHNIEKDRAKHTFDENKKCTVCDYITVKPLGLELQSSVFDINVAAKTAYLKVANAVEDYDFSDKFAVADGARFDVCTDKQCNNKIASKKADIFAGDNVFYILVTNGNDVASYTLTLRRRQIYTVTFDTNGGSAVESQQVEEDNFAAEPATTTKVGYDFVAWDYNFSSPILQDETITASWNIITYKITYELNGGENSENNPTTYTVEDEITLVLPTKTGYTGAWDNGGKIERGTTGDITFSASYTINQYNVNVTPSINGICAVTDKSGTYDYSTPISLKISDIYLGYAFIGWYNGETLLSADSAYTFNVPANDITITAKLSVKEEMQNYDFTSTVTTCEITRVKDKTIKSAVIPDYVTSIDWYAFSGCSGLASVTIGNSVTSIGSSAFSGCSGLTSVTIGNSVTSIGSYAFSGCSGLTSVTIGNSVTSIGYEAFYNCTGLTSIVIPDSVTSIDYYAFSGSGLTSVTIPDSVTSIGSYAFYNCRGLTSITIPDSVTSIGSSAFSGCSGLTSVTIPDSVTSIGYEAFKGCSKLTSITLPFVGGSRKSANDTYQYPFGYIFGASSYSGGVATKQYYYGSSTSSTTYGTYYIPSSLKTVTITGESILYGAFYNCKELTSITIPDSVTSIYEGAFSGCSKLENIYITDIAAWCNIPGLRNLMCYGSNNKKLYLNNELIIDLIIPDSVTSIDYYAFYNCSGLTSVTIPDSVTSIGNYAFYGCSGLTSVTIPDSVTSIGNYAFYGCSGLTSIIIPDSVTSIDYYAFYNCSGLTSIIVSEGNANYHSKGNCLIETKTKTLIFGCKTSVIPEDGSVTSIGNFAFYGCSGLKSITIPDSITSIEGYAFYGCSGLTSIIIPDSVTSIGYSAFSGCSGLTTIRFNGTKEQWNAISKGSDWNYNTGNYTIYCTDGNITK